MLWTPKQLLHNDKIELLQQSGAFSDTKIEFLGWLPGNAYAINHSFNPVKAAHTVLSKEGNQAMIVKFLERKEKSLHPEDVAEHDSADNLFRGFENWKAKNVVEAEGDEYAPEE
jgi:hypothetical protein